jgi:xylulokinase
VSYLGIDLGTSSAKAVLIDEDGHVRASESSRYRGHDGDSPGEADTTAWWDGVIRCVRAVIDTASADDVRGIGVAGQMHGLVLCDETGRPVRHAITWSDNRASAQLQRFRDLPIDRLASLGNPLAAGMAGPILLWLAEHEPARLGTARWALQPKDWLRLRLTGRVAGDPSDASATLLFDLYENEWAFDVIETLGLRTELFAKLAPSASLAGELCSAASDALGVAAGTPVAIGAADTAAALLAADVADGEALLNIGSGGQIVEPTALPAVHPLRLTNAYRDAELHGWYAMAAIQNVGIALEWTLRLLRSDWEEIYDVALPQTPPGADDLFFIPYIVGERGSRASLTGAWLGLRASHDRRHLLRAAVEGVSYSLRDGLERLEESPGRFQALWLSGGSTRWPAWQQLLADVLGRPLGVTDADSPRGAALLAAIAIGDLPARQPRTTLTIEPSAGARDHYEARYQRFLELTGNGVSEVALTGQTPAAYNLDKTW